MSKGPAKGKGRGGPAKGKGKGPATGYSWSQFEVTHGARSPALVEPRARELAPEVLEANAHLDAARDGAAVFRYAVTLARVERVYRWLSEQDDAVFVDEEAGKPHGVFERLEKWETQADRAEERLAIAPLTRAKLGLQRVRGEALVEHLRRVYGGES